MTIGFASGNSKACCNGSRNLSCSMSIPAVSASDSKRIISSIVSFSRFRILAASFNRLNEKSSNEVRDAVRKYSTETWLGTHHPLAFPRSKKNLRRVHKFAPSTLPVTSLSRLIMGTERKAITFKAIAENEAWLESEVARLNAALSPLEVRKSGLLNALVSMARTQQIQLPLNFLQGKPSLPGKPEQVMQRVACESEHRDTESGIVPLVAGGGLLSPESAAPSNISTPQKAVRRRAEKTA